MRLPLKKKKKKKKATKVAVNRMEVGFNEEDHRLDVDGVDAFPSGENSAFDDGNASSYDEEEENGLSAQKFPTLDEWLCDLTPFRSARESSGDFVFSKFMSTGFIWAVVEAFLGYVLTSFQHAGSYLSQMLKFFC